jgi:hypothetical protein
VNQIENRNTHGQLKLYWRSAQGTLTLGSKGTHARLKGHSRSAQGTLTLGSKYTHVGLKVHPRWAQSTLTLLSSYSHAQFKVHSRSAQVKFTLGSRYTRAWLKLSSLLAQGTLTLGSSYTHAGLKLHSRLAQVTVTLSSRSTHARFKLSSLFGSRYTHAWLKLQSRSAQSKLTVNAKYAQQVSWNWVSCSKISHGEPNTLLADLPSLHGGKNNNDDLRITRLHSHSAAREMLCCDDITHRNSPCLYIVSFTRNSTRIYLTVVWNRVTHCLPLLLSVLENIFLQFGSVLLHAILIQINCVSRMHVVPSHTLNTALCSRFGVCSALEFRIRYMWNSSIARRGLWRQMWVGECVAAERTRDLGRRERNELSVI